MSELYFLKMTNKNGKFAFLGAVGGETPGAGIGFALPFSTQAGAALVAEQLAAEANSRVEGGVTYEVEGGVTYEVVEA